MEKIKNHNGFGLILISTPSLVVRSSSLYYPSACLNPHQILVFVVVVVVVAVVVVVVVCISRGVL